MKTVLLCGGYGTRIRDVADDIPKPMIPIGEYPILWHIMKYYSQYSFKNFVICLGYKGYIIKDFFINYKSNTSDFTIDLSGNNLIKYHTQILEMDWEVTLAETGKDTMTGGRIKRIQKYVSGEDDFMLTYGDGVGNIDLNKLLKFHKSHGKILTVSGVRPPGRFGEMEIDKNKRVTAFNEKPQATEGRINGGFFVCRKEIFNYLNDREDLVFEEEPITHLVDDRELMIFEHDGFWQPMDTSRDYRLLNGLYKNGEAPWVIW